MNSPCPAVSRDDELGGVESSNDGTSDKESENDKAQELFHKYTRTFSPITIEYYKNLCVQRGLAAVISTLNANSKINN